MAVIATAWLTFRNDLFYISPPQMFVQPVDVIHSFIQAYLQRAAWPMTVHTNSNIKIVCKCVHSKWFQFVGLDDSSRNLTY